VDLDTRPHTTLSERRRVFNQHCFTIEGLTLPPKHHVGVTALASANSQPDAVDVYAVEVFEVLKGKEVIQTFDSFAYSWFILTLLLVVTGTSGERFLG
jgi:hypothetical protein